MITLQDVGPASNTFPYVPGHSAVGRITVLALAANGTRIYGGSFAGIWRSDDGGQTWRQLMWPAPAPELPQTQITGALYAPHIFDLAASPNDSDVLLASALESQLSGSDGIYRTADGGATWDLVFATANACNLAFAPDDPDLVYAATGSGVIRSTDAGVTWVYISGYASWHVAVGPLESNGIRRIYAIGGALISYSTDGGMTWFKDAGVATIVSARAQLDALRKMWNPNDKGIGGFAGETQIETTNNVGGRILAVEPGNSTHVYLAIQNAANGPSYYAPGVDDGTLCNTVANRLAGEGSLWLGDFSQFNAANPIAQWTQLPGPPVYYGVTSPSGVVFLAIKSTSSGFLLFFSDASHVHVSSGTPTATSWHRLDGEDASVAKKLGHDSNVVFVHPDPHGIAFTNHFEIILRPASGIGHPYNQNSELQEHIAGTLWLANDGGVNWCDDGGSNAQSWHWPLGLATLDPVNIAGLYGIGTAPALYFGCGDNDDFFSRDGGTSWGDPGSNCGDCDGWFADPAQPDRVMQFLPRRYSDDGSYRGYIDVIISSDRHQYPDASDSGSKHFIPSTRALVIDPNSGAKSLVPYASSGRVLRGYRPIIQTLPAELPLADGDYVFINQDLDTGASTLLRTTAICSISKLSDWADTSKAIPIGPLLPPGADIVQVGGGHANPVYYVGDAAGSVYKLSADQTTWDQIVPHAVVIGNSVKAALSWFIHAYQPETIFLLDLDGAKRSDDGGATWSLSADLTGAITAGGAVTMSAAVLHDMQFPRDEARTMFAIGNAGVFGSLNFGANWFPVLNAFAVPGHPEAAFFDPRQRALYVESEGRSILRVGGIPQLLPSPIDLLEFAALEY